MCQGSNKFTRDIKRAWVVMIPHLFIISSLGGKDPPPLKHHQGYCERLGFAEIGSSYLGWGSLVSDWEQCPWENLVWTGAYKHPYEAKLKPSDVALRTQLDVLTPCKKKIELKSLVLPFKSCRQYLYFHHWSLSDISRWCRFRSPKPRHVMFACIFYARSSPSFNVFLCMFLS